jgi:hypothetical protein
VVQRCAVLWVAVYVMFWTYAERVRLKLGGESER